jgi:predicted nucleic acid-binding protein
MILFLDTNVVIYFIENTPGFGPRAEAWIDQHRQAGHVFAVSDLVRMEARVMPTRSGDAALLALFARFFALADVRVLPLTAAVCDRATQIRATLNFKTPDSIQLAAAIVHGCDRFLTADGRLNWCKDIPVDVLP